MPSISVKELLFWKKKQLFKGGDNQSLAFLLDCTGGISKRELSLLSINLENNLYLKTDLDVNNIINLKSEVKKWLSEKVNVFALYKHEYYNTKEDFQFKVGLGVKLWN